MKVGFSILIGIAATAANAQFSENWDGYATGTPMHGVGGWKGWDNTASAGASTSSAFSSSAPNAIDINGASDLVHLFNPTAGQWVWKMNQFVPNSFTGKSYFILLNTYNDTGPYDWSAQLFFDGATNTVNEDLYTNPPAPLPLVRNAWTPIRFEIDLTLDSVTEKYNGATLWSHTWTSSGTSALAIAAVDLYANLASPVYYDDILLLPNPYPVNASAYTVTQGLNFGGTLASLAASDNNKVFVLCDELNTNSEVQFSGTSLDRNPVDIKVIVEEASSRTDISLFTSIWRASNSTWQQIHFVTSTIVDQTYVSTVSANTSDYFTTAGVIKARVLGIPQTDIDAGDGWTVSMDQGRFELTP